MKKHTHVCRGIAIIKFLNIKGKKILKPSTEKNRSHAKEQTSQVALYSSTFTQKTMYEAMEDVLKTLMKNYFQTRIPCPAKSSLKGEIKIKPSVMQGFNSFTSHVEDAFHQRRK